MQRETTYRLVAGIILLAFIQLLLVKQLHHHEVRHAHDVCCVLDHLPVSECSHSHTSVLEWDVDEDDCAICHFIVVKFFVPKYVTSPVPLMQYRVLQEGERHFLPAVLYARCLGRAPPVCVIG